MVKFSRACLQIKMAPILKKDRAKQGKKRRNTQRARVLDAFRAFFTQLQLVFTKIDNRFILTKSPEQSDERNRIYTG